VNVDLKTFEIGASQLGKPPAGSDPFTKILQQSDVYKDDRIGIEIGTKEGVLDYAFLTMESFVGRFLAAGALLEIDRDSTEAQIAGCFGEPYWADRSDGEVILFYEEAEGSIEIQFEFPDGRTLGYVTLARNGVLSSKEQRRAYGVDKPWPPMK
jgi:hypothetical protein